MKYNFDKYTAQTVSPFNVPYDYSSVMHYGKNAFSTNGRDTITPKQNGAQLGQRDGLSSSDIKKINNMYCPGTFALRFHNVLNDEVLDVKAGTAVQGREVVTWSWNNGDNQKWTADWGALLDLNKGSLIWSWAQDGGAVKVLDENVQNSYIVTWSQNGNKNQLWTAQPTNGNTRFLIRNRQTGRCLFSAGSQQAKTEPCNANDSRQLWNIYTF